MSLDNTQTSLELILQISRELATTLELKEALSKVIQLSMENVGAERGSLIAVNNNHEPIVAAIFADGRLVPYTIDQVRTILSYGLAGQVIKNQEPVWIVDTSKDERWLRRPDDAANKTGAKSAICIALKARDQLVGVLTIVHPKPDFFNQNQFDLLQTIADLAGITIHNAILYDSLDESNQRYQELFDDSIDPIIITDWDGKIIVANRQARQWIGASYDDSLKLSMQDFHQVNWEEAGDNFSKLLDGDTANYESEFHSLDSKVVPVEIHVRKVIINESPLIQWTLRDISERKALDALREDLMSMIYHDLRSPLANIISSLDILDTLLPKDTSITPVFQIAIRSTDRMQRLINSLLDIKRLEAGQPITNPKFVNMNSILNESNEILSPTYNSKRQTIELDIEPNLPELFADEGMIKRVVINLLENAIKFSPLDGKIILSARPDGEQVLISIKDSGPGIPDEAQDRIFTKFTRLDAKTFPKGIGLGLAFCKLAVNAHDGKIWVESTIGKGSQFNILLPLKKEEKQPETLR
ncbi:MAG: ATP-binding protein [Anaerolineaceae bacterium]|nr:ATP-binding protein [Anaerolineaceae bacterium]